MLLRAVVGPGDDAEPVVTTIPRGTAESIVAGALGLASSPRTRLRGGLRTVLANAAKTIADPLRSPTARGIGPCVRVDPSEFLALLAVVRGDHLEAAPERRREHRANVTEQGAARPAPPSRRGPPRGNVSSNRRHPHDGVRRCRGRVPRVSAVSGVIEPSLATQPERSRQPLGVPAGVRAHLAPRRLILPILTFLSPAIAPRFSVGSSARSPRSARLRTSDGPFGGRPLCFPGLPEGSLRESAGRLR